MTKILLIDNSDTLLKVLATRRLYKDSVTNLVIAVNKLERDWIEEFAAMNPEMFDSLKIAHNETIIIDTIPKLSDIEIQEFFSKKDRQKNYKPKVYIQHKKRKK